MKTEKHNTKGVNEVTQVQWRICSWAITSALILAVLFIIFHEKAIGKGLLLGTFFSVINFLILGKTIPMTLGRSRPIAGLIGLTSILSRYIILAVPLIMAIKLNSFNLIAVVVGIFAIQIVTLIGHIIIRPILYEK